MKEYLKISLILSTFGFLKETRPSEPFIVEFLLGYKNVTNEQINQNIFPIGGYSQLAQLVIIFLITDLLRYKPLIILLGACGVAIWSIFLWTNSLISLQIIEVIYGTFCATEVAYFSYIYAKTDKEHYQVVTSHTRAAIWAGKFVASLSAQLLFQFDVMDVRQLNYLTLITQIVAFCWAFFIPRVDNSVYFNPRKQDDNALSSSNALESDTPKPPNRTSGALNLIFTHFKTSYNNKTVVLWSVYYAIALCFYIQIYAYIQVLWIEVNQTQASIQNGYVDAILTFLGAAATLLAGKIHMSFLKKQNRTLLVLIVMSSLQGIFVVLAATRQSLLPCYIFYVCFGVSYAFGITICATEIAKNLADDTFGLVFGFNTLVALAVQTVITLSIVSSGFKLSPSAQFQVYGYFYIALGAAYFVNLLYDNFKSR